MIDMNQVLIIAAASLLSTNTFFVEVFGCKMAIPAGFYLSESSYDTENIAIFAEPKPNAKAWGGIIIQNHPEITQAGPSESGIHELLRRRNYDGKLEAYDFTLRDKESNKVMIEQLIVRDKQRLVSFQGDAIEAGERLLEDCQ